MFHNVVHGLTLFHSSLFEDRHVNTWHAYCGLGLLMRTDYEAGRVVLDDILLGGSVPRQYRPSVARGRALTTRRIHAKHLARREWLNAAA